MWIAPESKNTLEKALLEFLDTVAAGRPRAARILLVEDATLREVYKDPHPVLGEALHRCVNALLVDSYPDSGPYETIEVPVWLLGVALAFNNCLVDEAFQKVGDDFTTALIDTLPAARGRAQMFAVHALLCNAPTIHFSRRTAAPKLSRLIERSPLSALWFLDEYMPKGLASIARELLPWLRSSEMLGEKVWADDNDWLCEVSSLLADSNIARLIRQRWLIMPETRISCRHVGLMLEALRRRAECRDFCLEFYEAYDYFRAETAEDASAPQRRWPLMARIERLLRVPGDNDAVLQVNRWGNEYFLKFRALREIIIAEGVLPKDYQLLTLPFVKSMDPLLPYITDSGSGISFGEVTFEQPT